MAKSEATVDRRVRKTKKLLLDGLTQLMQTKDVSEISVKELSDLVDINRGTFYLHYRDIFDMLNKTEDELFFAFQRDCRKRPSHRKSPEMSGCHSSPIFKRYLQLSF